MTTCTDIIRMAMQRLRQLRAGTQPTGQEAADGLVALQALYDGWTGDGLFGRLNDTIISAAYTANEQDRVINDGGYTITLPLTITPQLPTGSYYPVWPDQDYWSWFASCANRPPRDLAMIEVVANGATQRSIYDRTKRAWVRLDGLTLTSEAPLSSRGSYGIASCLAEKWADDFGVPVGPSTVADATQFRWGLSARYDSQRVAAMQDYF